MTLYLETDKADGLARAGLLQEKTPGATDHGGAARRRDRVPPAGRGLRRASKAETATMIPMINDFMNAYDLDEVVVVADAGMISAANKQALERAGLSYVLGCSRTPACPPRDQLLVRQPPRPGRPRLTDPDPALARRPR